MHPSIRVFPTLALAGSLLLGAACDATGNEAAQPSADATFTVEAVDSARVPSAIPYEYPPLYVDCQLIQSGGVLVLFASGRYTVQVSSGAVRCAGGAGSGGGYAMTGDYVRDGEKITLKPDFGLPWIVGEYSPTAGGTIMGTGHNGATPVPQITLTLGTHHYRLTQEPSELP